ncbi:hypothetical protein TNCV_1500101 [Trichonephila clavipes]|nr:hypothetical protein TNCV_1500101 [Trichonephila clavipes]
MFHKADLQISSTAKHFLNSSLLNHPVVLIASPIRNQDIAYKPILQHFESSRGSLLVKVTDSWPACHEFELVPLKTLRLGERFTLNLSRAQTSSRWCGGEISKGGGGSVFVT